MEHTPDELEFFSLNQKAEEKGEYHKRPLGHRILSWILIVIVLFAFLGTCYWLAFYGVK